MAPEKISSYAALDALISALADRRRFPALEQIVVAGHSGGAQVTQRYAIAGQGADTLAKSGIGLRFVIANPSSYAWFADRRPQPEIVATCPGYNRWKYGMRDRPAPISETQVAELERRYVGQDVIYLLGDRDTDPHHPALDNSCPARTQGPQRFARGQAFVQALRERNQGAPKHLLWVVAGVGHDGPRMFNSACGLQALFDRPGCASDAVRSKAVQGSR